jgi:hypothetical protein
MVFWKKKKTDTNFTNEHEERDRNGASWGLAYGMELFGTKWNWMELFSVKKNCACDLGCHGSGILWCQTAQKYFLWRFRFVQKSVVSNCLRLLYTPRTNCLKLRIFGWGVQFEHHKRQAFGSIWGFLGLPKAATSQVPNERRSLSRNVVAEFG